MTTRKLVRRIVLTAAVSTASVMYTVDSDLFGFETAAKMPSSGNQQAQHQSGQGGGQPNSAVAQELNRMFQESGQPMPSMNPADLPNAQGQHSTMVRPRPQSAMQQPAKKNFLQKFMGKITGQDQKTAEARVVPPVPPGFNSTSPAAHSNPGTRPTAQSQNVPQGMRGQQAVNAPQFRQPGSQQPQNGQQAVQNGQNQGMQNVAAQSGSTSQPRTSHNAAQPGMRQGTAAPLRSAQTVQPNGQGQRMNQPSRSVPPVPGATEPGTTAPGAQQLVRGTQQYVQPGTAPAFMPSSQAARPEMRGPVQHTAAATSVASSEPLPAPPVDDDFEDPFKDSGTEPDAGETMDLDSLIEIPKSESTVSAMPDAPTQSAEAVRPAAADTAAIGSQSPFTQDGAPSAVDAEELNPFTGVRLNETDAEMFDPGLNESAVGGTSFASPTTAQPTESTETSGVSVPPMEDFGANLPAINLPIVDEIPAASESSPLAPVDVTESEATPLRSVDAERLQQAAEQDRRIRQQRLILSRTGQTGFKGFCPVALRDRRDLVDVNPEITATFGLQTYTFSSVEGRAAFEADPSRYAPAAGGSDVVLLVNSGEEQPGMLDYALWYRDRLYLFRSRETMALFNGDPLRFANQY